MGFYSDSVVPRLVTCACGTKPILKQREKIVPKAAGRAGIDAHNSLNLLRSVIREVMSRTHTDFQYSTSGLWHDLLALFQNGLRPAGTGYESWHHRSRIKTHV